MEMQSGQLQSHHSHDVALTEKVIKTMAEVVDNKIEELDTMDNSELERLRRERIKSMKQAVARTNELLSKGHGEYEDVEEKLFFKVSTDSDKVIAHFYAGNLPLCDIFHMYLKELARSHVESRFVKINAEKSPFLVNRLSIQRYPTIIIIANGVTVDRVVGNVELCGQNQLTKEALEWRLSLRGGIKYDGDYDPMLKFKTRRTAIKKVYKKKTVRERDDSSSEDD